MGKGDSCYTGHTPQCSVFMGIIVIVFAWWNIGGNWSKIILTVIGAILILTSLGGSCLCKTCTPAKKAPKKARKRKK